MYSSKPFFHHLTLPLLSCIEQLSCEQYNIFLRTMNNKRKPAVNAAFSIIDTKYHSYSFNVLRKCLLINDIILCSTHLLPSVHHSLSNLSLFSCLRLSDQNSNDLSCVWWCNVCRGHKKAHFCGNIECWISFFWFFKLCFCLYFSLGWS